MAFESTRRGFLGGAMAAAGLAGAAPADESAPDLKLGVASYSLREFQRGLAVRIVKQLQVAYVSIKEMHLPYRGTPEELRRGARDFTDAGLIIAGGSTIYMLKDDDDDIRNYFEYAKTCGMPLMAIGTTHQALPRVEKFVKEYGIAVALHNHGPEDRNFPSPQVALQAIRGMDPRVGVCIDVGHTTRTGAGAVESIQEAGPRLLDMHMKDLRDLMKKDSQCPVGEGAMPVAEIFKTLKAMKYQGCVNLEYEIDADNPLPGMAKSFGYMRGVLAGLRS
ncbi:MAG: sugar phosphate isomerase/epimerase family protein [Bryobacteraceae bacterium]